MGFLVLFSKASSKWFFIVSIILYSMVLTKVCWIFLTVSINLFPNFFVSVFPVSITMVAKRRKARVSFLGKFDFFCWNGITLVLTFVWFWVFFLSFGEFFEYCQLRRLFVGIAVLQSVIPVTTVSLLIFYFQSVFWNFIWGITLCFGAVINR